MGIGKSTVFIEVHGKSGAGDVVSAGVEPENGGQAAVRGKMRNSSVNEDKYAESKGESEYEFFVHNPFLLLVGFVRPM